ncbi:hypothetical protein EVAR_52625_1 [Eumeta japonica]|uniref:Secreted protein n=1 Tax=Eumeta variegata TaxID=151549 RepID=A0A4C1Y0G5_EUMVA|nr:hypothetical protein EVAR_52625_1 [Eumeta japonica]
MEGAAKTSLVVISSVLVLIINNNKCAACGTPSHSSPRARRRLNALAIRFTLTASPAPPQLIRPGPAQRNIRQLQEPRGPPSFGRLKRTVAKSIQWRGVSVRGNEPITVSGQGKYYFASAAQVVR